MLTGKQKRHLRALGHSLKAIIQIGKKEIEEGLISEANAALDHHELIKVKLLESCMLGKNEASVMLAEACCADVAQILGKTFLLYRPAKEPVISFNGPTKSPKAAKPAPAAPPDKKAPPAKTGKHPKPAHPFGSDSHGKSGKKPGERKG
jgi:RNA-binding protein